MKLQFYFGGRVLKDRFSRLFELFDNKMATMVEMKHLGWGEGRGG